MFVLVMFFLLNWLVNTEGFGFLLLYPYQINVLLFYSMFHLKTNIFLNWSNYNVFNAKSLFVTLVSHLFAIIRICLSLKFLRTTIWTSTKRHVLSIKWENLRIWKWSGKILWCRQQELSVSWWKLKVWRCRHPSLVSSSFQLLSLEQSEVFP